MGDTPATGRKRHEGQRRWSRSAQLTWPPAGGELPVMALDPGEPAAARPGPRRPARAPHPAAATAGRRRQSPWAAARRLPPRLAAAVLGSALLVPGVAIVARIADGGEQPAPSAEAARAVAAPPRRASLAVRTLPSGAAVFLDGRARGTSPLSLPSMEPGGHRVTVRLAGRTIEHAVELHEGETLSLVIPLADAPAPRVAPEGGSVRVRAPVELRVSRDGELLGTSEMDRIPLGPGAHTLVLANDAIGYRETRRVQVSPGRTTTLDVAMPEAAVAINATPWAEVEIDGAAAGETPLGGLALTAGPHVVVFRHPRLGEKTVRVVVKAGAPTRIGVDMTR
ncbi:MAG: Serine/threonine protein kinase [Acidobacteria bacterium]|nr:Serine/threonine protein kinase [Acidobacteriota bacterium]